MPHVAKLSGLILISLMPLEAAAQHSPPPREMARDDAARPVSAYSRSMADRLAPSNPSPSWSNGPVQPPAYAAPKHDPSGHAGQLETGPTTPESTPLPLSPPEVPLSIGRETSGPKHGSTTSKTAPGWSTLVTIGSSLAVVLGLFFVFAWFLRRAAPAGAGVLPGEVVEVLGRAPLASRQHVHLLRCGKKLLLVSATQAGIETLTEITEPDEVDRLAGLCKQSQPGSSTALFRQVFQQYGQKETPQTRWGGRTERGDAGMAAAGLSGSREGTWEGVDG